MSYNKRDYLYDVPSETAKTQHTDPSKDPSGDHGSEPRHMIKDRTPMSWVQDLLFDLQDAADAKGVELLGLCTSTRLAEFVGRYDRSAWRY